MRGLINVTITISLVFAMATTKANAQCTVVDKTYEVDNTMVVEGFPFFTTTIAPSKQEYPELYSTNAVIAVFCAESCRPCKRTTAALKPHIADYNMVFYDVLKNSNHYKLMQDILKLGTSVPVVAIVEKGKVKKAFQNYTPWLKIKPYAKNAKKRKGDPTDIHVSPITINIDEDEDIDVRVFDGSLRDRMKNRRLRRQEEGGAFQQFRDFLNSERLQEMWVKVKTWVIENWDTIIRVAVMVFMLL
jgi:glutaredoxin